jgi:hypothetical protein
MKTFKKDERRLSSNSYIKKTTEAANMILVSGYYRQCCGAETLG